ncbi:hypothetical protein CSTAT_03365 [Corynebacterium stationis]|nr:hypothetical protein CSTAT_03365 [Corynebacterium stationis]
MDAEVETQLVEKLVKQIITLMVGNPSEGEHIEQGFLPFAQQETADRDGFIAPTVLANVLLDIEAAQEEIFESEDEAINRANQTRMVWVRRYEPLMQRALSCTTQDRCRYRRSQFLPRAGQ